MPESSEEVRLIVDAVGDAADASPDDGRCATREGGCTLRAAIETLNRTGGGTIDFDLPSRDGRATIRPRRALPAVEQPVTIDGYSQPGSEPNRARAPAALDGAPAVQIDGSLARAAEAALALEGEGSVVRGLVVSNFEGAGIVLGGDGSIVEGSYIGTDARGLVDQGNRGAGVSGTAEGVRIGGPRPEQRNIISGNEDSAIYPKTGWIVQGNLVGVGADGTSPIANGVAGGPGALSIDEADDVLIGGVAPEEANVISANASFGLAPLGVRRLSILGNLIGVGADGRTPLGNGSVGIALADGEDVEIAGNLVMHNDGHGILVASSARTIVGGPGEKANVVSGNRTTNIAIWSTDDENRGVEVVGNRVGTDPSGAPDPAIENEIGISVAGRSTGTVVGGVEPDEANVVAGGSGPAIAVLELRAVGYAEVLTPTDTVMLCNEVLGGDPGEPFVGPDYTPFDVAVAWDTSSPIDLIPDRYDGAGRRALPATAQAIAGFGDAEAPTVELDPAAPDTKVTVRASGTRERFRVELFLVDARASAATMVGAATVEGGSAATIEIPPGLRPDLPYLAATSTLLDPEGSQGFGSTSELSQAIDRW